MIVIIFPDSEYYYFLLLSALKEFSAFFLGDHESRRELSLFVFRIIPNIFYRVLGNAFCHWIACHHMVNRYVEKV